jgi:tetratricopeptide (TPR) repeat protein
MAYAKTSLRREKRDLREKMRSMGLGYRDIAGEFARRYRLRPRAAWREAYGWSLQETAGRINDFRGETGLDPGGFAGMTAPHLSEYENWPGHGPVPAGRRPTPYLLAVLAAVYGCAVAELVDLADREHLPASDLLIHDRYSSMPSNAGGLHSVVEHASRAPGRPSSDAAELHAPVATAASARVPRVDARAVFAERPPRPGHGDVIADWPTWFGVKLAQLISLTDAWRPEPDLGPLQTLLNEEILMADAAIPCDGQSSVLHALSRRQVLMTLGALPMAAMSGPGDDAFLSRCAVSLASCWHLLRGSDLHAVELHLGGYLLPLEAFAQRPSRQRQAAAVLAAQAHRIGGIVALHRNQLAVREAHCKRALQFAEIACDASSHASALISLASTYFYAADPEAAAAVYEQAFRHGDALPQLQRSRVHAELAVVYGQLGREQDSVRAAAEAEELYPDHPQQDPSFLYAEFTPASLTLERGLAFIALAERFPGRSYQKKAADVFALATGPELAVPDRIRFEIINHQATTAVLSGDLNAFETFLLQGLDGVALLGSKQRLREMQATWHRARQRWPAEERVLALNDGLREIASRVQALN